MVPLLNARAALALWRMGELTGDPLFTGRGKRALESVLDDALASPEAAPAAALAALAMDTPPVRMVVTGPPRDPGATALRQAAFFIFEPRKVLLGLDPSADASRIQALSLPAAPTPRSSSASTPSGPRR